MAYLTPAELAKRPGAQELAEVATASHRPVVSAELMQATLLGESRTEFDAGDIADADDALARILEAVDEASSTVDGFLKKRGYTVPLLVVPNLVCGWTRDITRYLLHKDRLSSEGTDPILRAYKDAMKFLQLTAEGKFSLGAEDPLVNAVDSVQVQFESDSKVFSRDELKSFR